MIYITKGLPGSGKSTWARGFINDSIINGDYIVHVSLDEIRDRLHRGVFSKQNEKEVIRERNNLARFGVENGYDVIVDSTALNPIHIKYFQNTYPDMVKVVDFTHVPLETCIARDALREKPVGREVIENMYRKWLQSRDEASRLSTHYQEPSTIDNFEKKLKYKAVIVDLDGTLAHKWPGRTFYDSRGVYNDTVDELVKTAVAALFKKYSILVVSARKAEAKEESTRWLDKVAETPYTEVHFREDGDNRDDAIVKREIYEKKIAPFYNVVLVIDDRAKVVKMWRSLGLRVWQVAEGNF